MRRVVYFVAASVDGFIAEPDGAFHRFPMEGDHVADYLDRLRSFGAAVMGRSTYEVGLRMGVRDPYPWMPTHVFSRTLPDDRPSEAPNVTVHRGDPSAVVRALREEEGAPIYLCGGGRLAGALLADGLVDALWLKVSPLVLGRGRPLFDDAGVLPRVLEHRTTRSYRSGVVLIEYDLVAPPDATR